MSTTYIRSNNDLTPKCIKCGKKYNLSEAVRRAERENREEIKCPYCKAELGKIN